MAAAARKIELEPRMHERTVIEEKVDHLQKDVTEIKADVRRLDGKIDAVSASLSEHRLETEKSIGKLRDETKDSIAALRNEMKESFAKLHGNHTSQIAWTVSTVIAAAGAAFTAAKFFSTP